MGLNASGDIWNECSDAVIEGVEGAQKIVDDILLQAKNVADMIEKLRKLFERCRELGIILSLRKLKIGKEVPFAGYIVNAEKVRPDEKRIVAIKNFPCPKNVLELRCFMGLVNQLGHFVLDLAHVTCELRKLLKKNVQFIWLEEHDVIFQRIKDLLSSHIGIHHFDPKLDTELLTDASRLNGLGYALIHLGEDNEPRLVKCGSRSVSDAETRYMTIELECSAIQWVMVH